MTSSPQEMTVPVEFQTESREEAIRRLKKLQDDDWSRFIDLTQRDTPPTRENLLAYAKGVIAVSEAERALESRPQHDGREILMKAVLGDSYKLSSYEGTEHYYWHTARGEYLEHGRALVRALSAPAPAEVTAQALSRFADNESMAVKMAEYTRDNIQKGKSVSTPAGFWEGIAQKNKNIISAISTIAVNPTAVPAGPVGTPTK